MVKRLFSLALLWAPVVTAQVINIESAKQYKELEGSVVAMFTTAWCGPCKQIKPHFMELSTTYSGITFCLVDIEKGDLKEIDPSIKSVPTFVFTHKGEEREKKVGIGSKSKLKEFIEQNQATIAGATYQKEQASFLSAEEYFKKGQAYGRSVVEACSKKELTISEIQDIAQATDSVLLALGEIMQESGERAEKAFVFSKEFYKGMLKELVLYIPRQAVQQDSFITYLRNYAKFSIAAKNMAEVQQWSMDIMQKYQQKVQEYTWQICAELSAQ